MKYFKKNVKCLGPGAIALFIPQFIFSASACKHDSLYLEGGGLLDKLYADYMFYALMLYDIKKGEFKFFRKYFYFAMATIYLHFVIVFGVLFFKWKI